MKLFYFLLLSVFYFSCEHGKELNVEAVKLTEISIPVGAMANLFTTEVLYLNNEEFIGFGDFENEKKILLFNSEFKKTKEIPLNKIYNEFDEGIDDYFFVNEDSIAILENYTNRIYLINSQGEIIFRVKLDTVLKFGENYKDVNFEILNVTFGTAMVNHSDFIVDVEWSYTVDTVSDQMDALKKNSMLARSYPYFIQINNLFNSNETTFSEGNYLYKQLYPEDTNANLVFIDYANLFVTNGSIWSYSNSSNKLVRLDQEFNTYLFYEITSKFCDIGSGVFAIDEYESFEKLQEARRKGNEKGHIYKLVYNEKSKKYIMVLISELEGVKPSVYKDRDFIVQVYDENFKLLHEKFFEGLLYDNEVLVLNKGVHVRKKKDEIVKSIKELNYYYEEVLF